jgi:hypothetical protein
VQAELDFDTSDAPAVVLAFYRAALAGMKSMDMLSIAPATVVTFTGTTQIVGLTVMTFYGRTHVMLSVQPP